MLINIPTSESLNQVALRLYFSAWSELVEIRIGFDDMSPNVISERPTKEEKAAFLQEYLASCQPDLQSVCALIQQSNELALKARICEVSPFLLLCQNENRYSVRRKDLDFSDMRTIDAVDLPRAINTLCNNVITDKFIQSYNEIRSIRNKVIHLGQADKLLTPIELLHLMVFQYTQLWPNRVWLKDRADFQEKTRFALFYDGKYTSSHMEVMQELREDLNILTKSEFRALFKHEKTEIRYLCHHCFDAANTRLADLDIRYSKTAYLSSTGDKISCQLCGGSFVVARRRCVHRKCKGDVIANNQDDFDGICHVCGQEQ